MRSERASEFDLWHLLSLLGDRESLADFHIRVEDRCYPALWDSPQRSVVVLHGENVIAARDRDAIFGALELRLQREKILIRLEVWMGLGYREQAAKCAGECGLILLELMKGL